MRLPHIFGFFKSFVEILVLHRKVVQCLIILRKILIFVVLACFKACFVLFEVILRPPWKFAEAL